MASIAEEIAGTGPQQDRLSGTPRAHALDRWIYVITAIFFIAIVLAGFIPDSLMKIEMVRAGARRRSRSCCTCTRSSWARSC